MSRAKTRRLPHPQSECCTAPVEQLQAWFEHELLRVAHLKVQCREVRLAAMLARAESLNLTVRQVEPALAARLEAHGVRLCGLANGHAMDAQMIVGQVERVRDAHQFRLGGAA